MYVCMCVMQLTCTPTLHLSSLIIFIDNVVHPGWVPTNFYAYRKKVTVLYPFVPHYVSYNIDFNRILQIATK